jgi:hypothetical protein
MQIGRLAGLVAPGGWRKTTKFGFDRQRKPIDRGVVTQLAVVSWSAAGHPGNCPLKIIPG